MKWRNEDTMDVSLTLEAVPPGYESYYASSPFSDHHPKTSKLTIE